MSYLDFLPLLHIIWAVRRCGSILYHTTLGMQLVDRKKEKYDTNICGTALAASEMGCPAVSARLALERTSDNNVHRPYGRLPAVRSR